MNRKAVPRKSLTIEERRARTERVRARQNRIATQMPKPGQGLKTRAIVLHIGAHKTASSFLQTLLKGHSVELAQRGVGVVHRSHLLASPLQEALIAIGKGQAVKPPLMLAAAQSLRGMLARRKPHVLFSSEDLLHRIRDLGFFANAGKALEFVKSLAGPIPVRVVLYTRSQADYIESVYMQFMHLGRDFTFEEFIERLDGNDYSWKRVLDEMAAVVGPENVTAVPYEAIKRLGSAEFYRRFLEACGVPDAGSLQVPAAAESSRGANRSYSADALKIAKFVGPMIDDSQRAELRKFLQENFSTATHAKVELFTPEGRANLLESCAQDNRALFETWLKDWPEERRFYV